MAKCVNDHFYSYQVSLKQLVFIIWKSLHSIHLQGKFSKKVNNQCFDEPFSWRSMKCINVTHIDLIHFDIPRGANHMELIKLDISYALLNEKGYLWIAEFIREFLFTYNVFFSLEFWLKKIWAVLFEHIFWFFENISRQNGLLALQSMFSTLINRSESFHIHIQFINDEIQYSRVSIFAGIHIADYS